MRYYVALKMSNPFDADPNLIRNIPGLESSSKWLRDQFNQGPNLQQNIPGLLPAAGAVRGAFEQPPNLQEKIPGLIPAAGALRNMFGGKDPATAQPPGSSGSVTRFNGTEYNMSDPKQKAAYQKAQEAELKRQRSRSPMADIRGGDGLKPDGNGRFDAPPRLSPNVDPENQQGRESGKLSSAGFAEANDLLARLGITTTRYGDFQSNDLPGTPNTQSDYEAMGGSSTDADRYYSGEGVETVIDGNDTPVSAQQTAGSPNLTKSGGIDTTQEVKTAPLGSVARYGQEFMADRPGMRAQDSTSLVGLRAAEASKGLLYASGKYWKANPNAGGEGEKDFVEIQKDEWNTIKRGEVHAQDFLSEKIEEAKPKVSLDSEQESYQVPESQKPTSRIDSTAQVDTQQITEAPTLTQAVDVRFTDKDRTGRYNNFNNR